MVHARRDQQPVPGLEQAGLRITRDQEPGAAGQENHPFGPWLIVPFADGRRLASGNDALEPEAGLLEQGQKVLGREPLGKTVEQLAGSHDLAHGWSPVRGKAGAGHHKVILPEGLSIGGAVPAGQTAPTRRPDKVDRPSSASVEVARSLPTLIPTEVQAKLAALLDLSKKLNPPPSPGAMLIPLIVACALFMENLDFDRDLDRAAGDRGLARREPAGAQPRDHRLPVQPRGLHPDQRLGRRPVRGQARVPDRDPGLHAGLDPLRLRGLAVRLRARAHPAGHGRRHDGAGRPARAAALGRQGGAGAARWPG